ncbi:MAG: septum formation initiator family protein [Patescibacteria group bacterium]|nr:septum formation initiator family protein [Patescibacteria group bacterium]
MTAKYNLSPTEKLNYVQKGNIKGRGRRIFKQILLSLFILSLLILIIIPYLRNNKKRKDLENEIAKIQKEISQYEKTNEELKEFLSYLESDQAIMEKARVNLGLQKEGEKVVVIKRKDLELNSTGTVETQGIEDVSNFRKWLRYFFNN